MIRSYPLTITDGNGATFGGGLTANYVRCMDSSGVSVTVELEGKDGKTSRFEIEGGLGFRTDEFNKGRVVNNTGSTIFVEMMVSDEGAIDDSRLVMSGTMSVSTAAAESLSIEPVKNFTVLTEVCSARSNRKHAVVQLSGDCYINDSVNGILVTGTLIWENQAALNLIPVSGSVEARVMEELN